MLSCFPKVPAALGFYVTHKSLFFPLHQTLSAMILYSLAELNSTLPPKYILFSQHFTLVHVLTSPVISLPSSPPSGSRGSAGTNCPFHSPPNHAWSPTSTSSTNEANVLTKVSLAWFFCFLFVFSALWPYCFWIFKGRGQTCIFNLC